MADDTGLAQYLAQKSAIANQSRQGVDQSMNLVGQAMQDDPLQGLREILAALFPHLVTQQLPSYLRQSPLDVYNNALFPQQQQPMAQQQPQTAALRG